MNNFHYIAVLLDQLYGIQMEEENLEELGLIAWDLIGNKNTKLYRYSAALDANNSVTLPCNLSSLEAVTTNYEDWLETTNYSDFGDSFTSYVENSIEGSKYHTSPYYQSGKLIKYEKVGNTLYFSRNYGKVNILYKGILMDEDGLPEISDKEAHAIATYLAWIEKYKEGLRTNNTVMINLAQNLEQKWLKQCDQARVTPLSQNDMNEILDVKGSFDRASYGNSFKYRR